ncbi:MAG: NAD-dependent epimerase/dehydratase family protein [Chloroflexota bacterium]|nr:NAD-dependent epimerase/dehydratase family protein [Chloroflexota bacterium]
MRAFVTGAGGFIGLALVRRLRQRGDEVHALVRSTVRADILEGLGCQLHEGDLASVAQLREQMAGCDAVFHLAGIYRVGIPAAERPAMYTANVAGTANVLDAAVASGAARVIYVSTINAFGDTRRRVVDETYRRPEPPRYVSYYDETKHLAHLLVEARIAAGAPVLIVLPGGVYGPGDHSAIGAVMRQAAGGRLRVVTFPDLGMNMVHVDDVAAGITLAGDRGRIGEAYVLGGEVTTLGQIVRKAAVSGGKRPPRVIVPSWLVRALATPAGLIGPLLGNRTNLGELISASDGVTYWASDAKARRELGYEPRNLETGLRGLFDPA